VSRVRQVRRRDPAFRRSPHLVVHWRDGALRICNYATRQTFAANGFILDLLDSCGDWRTFDEVSRGLPGQPPGLLLTLMDRLVALSLLERSDASVDSRVAAMSRLAEWNPEVGFFQASTRDVVFAEPREASLRSRRRAAQRKLPPAVKRYAGAARIDLSRPELTGEFPQVLKARRTWRRFSSKPVDVGELSTLLALTAGVQQWVQADGYVAPLKTSPSGGSRHSIECYVVARDVRGLKGGIYHYASDRHALERISGPVARARLRDYVPGSGYFASASAFVFFTAVFERILWRYPYSRAYRAALAETGHLCQTFCLTATWQGLAPFCLMALGDSAIEQDLGIDGIGESVLYAAGVGRPPRATAWAANPAGKNPPAWRNPRL
jgi:SagB-type dehydrogenase family enzyme